MSKQYLTRFFASMLLLAACIAAPPNAIAQSPGGVAAGTTRGYKVDYYDGNYTSFTQFGAGTSNAAAGNSGYSNKITGNEFYNIHATNYGLEYTGTLEIATAGSYSFSFNSDDMVGVYIDGVLMGSISGVGTKTFTTTLTSGDHALKFKHMNYGGPASASLIFTATPTGSGIISPADVDGRFVRSANSAMSGWYKASDVLSTLNYGGPGVDRVNTLVNKAPAYSNSGNLVYNSPVTTGSPSASQSPGSNVNFNPGVQFDGDDRYVGGSAQKGLSYRGATKSMFLVTQYYGNVSQAGAFMFHHNSGNTSAGNESGIYKTDALYSQMARAGGGATGPASAYTVNEPKLFGGFLDQLTGGSAPNGTNPLSLDINGVSGTPVSYYSEVVASSGLLVDQMSGAYFSEAIYYPFRLSATEEKKVNSYLAIKYGISLAHDYLNTSGAVVFDYAGATNTGYKNSIFGIGRELTAEALNQKQSISRMTSAPGNDFIVVSKGSIAPGNASNTGTLADGDYLLMGDNAGALTPQAGEIPASFASAIGCTANRLGREWKVQVTGAPGAVTLRAGSSTIGSYLFPGSIAGLSILVDVDGDGDFTTGTVSTYPVTALVNGVATFNNVTLATGNVFTFGWALTSPGGVMKPTAGTVIGGATYVNGLAYNNYTTNGTTGVSIAAGFASVGGLKAGSGYLNQASNFFDFVYQKTNTNYAVELIGKIYIPAGSSTYQFRTVTPDDQSALIIDGATVLDVINNATTTSSNVTLSAGYHDIIFRGAQGPGSTHMEFVWNSGSGTTFLPIPDANFFVLPAGPSAWYKTDDVTLSTVSNGASVASWTDISGNSNNVTTSSTYPTLYTTTAAQLRNYNPSLSFIGGRMNDFGYLNGFSYYRQGRTLFGVAAQNANGNNSILSGYGNDIVPNPGGAFALYKSTGNALSLYGYNDNFNAPLPYYTSSAFQTDLLVGLYSNPGLTPTNNVTVFANGKVNGQGSRNSWSTYFNDNEQLSVGGSPDNANNWTGNINEVIYYPWDLTATERQRVNTYLAIKYSLPLNDGLGTTASDYLASDGITTPWLGSTTYKSGMFGIGRDDCSGLYQKQSRLGTTADNVAFGLAAIAATNAANTNTFSANKQFVMVGNDGGSFALTSSNVPASYAGVTCNPLRYTRNWKVKNTGGVTNSLQMTIGDATNRIAGNWKNVSLAINSAGDATFATGTTTLVTATNIVSGVATFDNVTLPDGAVFTVCFSIAYPGGVKAPIAGTNISGLNYVNGLAYNLYSVTATAASISTGFTLMGGIKIDSGYYNNASSFQNFPLQKIATNFGVELIGKLYVPSTTATYQFRSVSPDDQFALLIDGITLINVTAAGATFTTPNTSLTAGYHDVVIRGAQQGGGVNFDLTWNGGSGAGFTPIPDVNFFVLPTTPAAWYEADDNTLAGTLANGAALTSVNGNNSWLDLSGNGNTLVSEAGAEPTYHNTDNFIRNYNASFYFVDDKVNAINNYINGFAYGKQGKTMLGVAAIFNTGGLENVSSYGRDGVTSDQLGISKTSTEKMDGFGLGDDVSSPAAYYTSSTPISHLLGVSYTNTNINATNNAAVYGDNVALATASKPNWNVTMNSTIRQLTVGNAINGSTANGWNGNINEIIYYPWDLTAAERLRVNSYLALKWGQTIDQTTPTNYLASDGSVSWNAAANAAFKYDITGIGRDDCGNLFQKQSTSTDGADIISIGKDTVAATNAGNPARFTNDKSFTVFAHNNAASSFTSYSTDVPVIGAPCYKRLNREWMVQSTNSPDAVSMVVGKTGLFTFSAATFKPVLLISNTAGSYASATVVPATKMKNGLAYFDNVNFSGSQYFTVGFIEAAPGGVTANLTTWFNSDYAVYTDVAQTTNALNDNDVVKSISNLKNGATFSNVQEVSAAYDPLYKLGVFNYNNGILFDGVNDVLATAGNINTLDYRAATAMTSIFTGYNLGTGGSQNVFWFHDDGAGTNKTSLERQQGFWNSTTALTRTPALTTPEIYSFLNSTSGNYRLFSNQVLRGSGTAANTGTVNGRFRIGNSDLAGAGAAANFYLGELAIYSDDKGAATSSDMRKIHSYMATRYGFTLDQTAMGGAYIASDGTTAMFNHTGFWNRITGIGRDDCSALEQKQSFSQDASGGLVKISNDPVNGLAATNAANTAAFSANNSFEFFGDNNKSLTYTGVDNLPNNLARLNRVWRIKETGTVGTVFLQVAGYSSGNAVKLPIGNSATDPVYLVVANSASGGSFKNSPTFVPMLPSGTDWTVAYNFSDGDYYSFATTKFCIAPAGISDGLTSWYKADNKATGAIAATTGTFADETGANALTRNGSGTATIVAGSGTSFNYNKSLVLASGATLQKTGLSETAITATNAGTVYAVGLGTNNASLFGLSRASYNGVGIFVSPTFANSTTGIYGGTATASVPNIWSLVQNATTITGATNGVASSPVSNAATIAINATYGLRIGSSFGSPATATQVYGNNTFAEAISYNRELSASEQAVLNSYLAMKYGQTLATNYYSADYDGTNAATSTIYDVSTYGNHVFGLGIDSAGCFFQRQSTSQLSGGMLKASITNTLSTENTQNAGVYTLDRTYIAAGDDNGSVTSWTTGTTPAIYATDVCAIPSRIARQWKLKALNNSQTMLITIPDASSTAATKLPVLSGSFTSNVYMVVNENTDFATNSNQEEVLMTLNATSNEWEASYSFPAGVYKYITFIIKPTVAGAAPVIVASGTSDAAQATCNATPYIYYKGTSNPNNALIAINPNGNTWSPSGITVDNSGTLSGGGGTFSNTGSGYYQSTDGINTTRITKRLQTIVAPGSYPTNGGIIVRVFYSPSDLASMVSDPLPGSGTIGSQGWFKHSSGSAAATVAALVPINMPDATTLRQVGSGTDQGVNYVEFLVSSFSTFGYYVQTSPDPLAVDLTSFHATATDCNTNLEWTSAVENNLKVYELQFSKDGAVWDIVGVIGGKGNNGSYSYSYNGGSGAQFYRLSMVEVDGSYKYSKVLAVNGHCDENGRGIVILPNPVANELAVTGLNGGETIMLYDGIGKLLLKMTAVGTQTRMNASELVPGMYYVVVLDKNGGKISLKFTKK